MKHKTPFVSISYNCNWCGEDVHDLGQDWLDHFTKKHPIELEEHTWDTLVTERSKRYYRDGDRMFLED
jgi:hypothetical protein